MSPVWNQPSRSTAAVSSGSESSPSLVGSVYNVAGPDAVTTRRYYEIVADWRESFKRPALPAMYVPFDAAQFRVASVIVDAPDSPVLREQIQQSLTRLTPDTQVTIEPISALLDSDAAPVRFMLVVIGLFATLTLVLAMSGVYGVIAFMARERMREYGVRVALGATRRIIGVLVVSQAVVPIAAGLVAGLIAAVWTSRLLAAQWLGAQYRGRLASSAAGHAHAQSRPSWRLARMARRSSRQRFRRTPRHRGPGPTYG